MPFHENFIALDASGNEYTVTANVTYLDLVAGREAVYDYSIDGVMLKTLDKQMKIFQIKSTGIQIQDRRMI